MVIYLYIYIVWICLGWAVKSSLSAAVFCNKYRQAQTHTPMHKPSSSVQIKSNIVLNVNKWHQWYKHTKDILMRNVSPLLLFALLPSRLCLLLLPISRSFSFSSLLCSLYPSFFSSIHLSVSVSFFKCSATPPPPPTDSHTGVPSSWSPTFIIFNIKILQQIQVLRSSVVVERLVRRSAVLCGVSGLPRPLTSWAVALRMES